MTHRLDDAGNPPYPSSYYDWQGIFWGPGHDPDREEVDRVSGEVVLRSEERGGLTGVVQTDVQGVREASEERERERQLTETLSEAGTNEDQLRDVLSAAGVNAEGIAFVMSNPNMVDLLLSNEGQFVIPGLAEQFPTAASRTAYAAAQQSYGFTEAFPWEAQRGPEGPQPQFGGPPAVIREYEFSSETGAIRYRNGVIADPTTGQVFFPPSADVPGSPAWTQRIQSEWNPNEVAKWRKRLGEMGYLSPDQAKATGFDAQFLEAIKAYHAQRYLNFGQPLAWDTTAGAESEEPEVVLPDAAEIRNDVRAQFNRVFGEDPSDAELEDWTRFIRRTSAKLQRTKDYTPEYAAAAAEERAIEQLEQSPQGQFVRESVEENTDLHDALVSAVAVTRSLI